MYKNVNWNTSSTRKSEPPADEKLIKKLHDAWARARGYKRQAPSALKKPQLNSSMKLERNNMYTLKEIIDAWENNYGGDMKKDYPRFIKELIKNASYK